MIGNAPDEEHIDPHGECRHEIHRLTALLSAAEEALRPFADVAKTLGPLWALDPEAFPDDMKIVRKVDDESPWPSYSVSAAVSFISYGDLRKALRALPRDSVSGMNEGQRLQWEFKCADGEATAEAGPTSRLLPPNAGGKNA